MIMSVLHFKNSDKKKEKARIGFHGTSWLICWSAAAHESQKKTKKNIIE